MRLQSLQDVIGSAPLRRVHGRVLQVVGPLVEADLPGAILGAMCGVGDRRLCEVVGFKGHRTLLMPLQSIEGVAHGTPVEVLSEATLAPVGDELIGRVLDGLGQPVDDGPPLTTTLRRRITGLPPNPMDRQVISEPLATGVRVIDALMPLARGQRIIVTAGSGVGKSTLLGMLARYVESDIAVVCLVGERGREVREFVEHNLGPEGLKRSVVVAATSDKSPALQIKSAQLATTIAEYFRDRDKSVLLLMDSLTRLALAQRQIGLATGEPPTTRGYTPSVFALLPPLLERAGPGSGSGCISAVYTVLVEGDDENDPINDAVRGIVDGHVVLSRKLASHGHYPAVKALSSLSRVAPRVSSEEHQRAAHRFRHLLATYEENEELIRLGAYRPGTSAVVDEAVARHPAMIDFLRQDPNVPSSRDDTISGLVEVSGV